MAVHGAHGAVAEQCRRGAPLAPRCIIVFVTRDHVLILLAVAAVLVLTPAAIAHPVSAIICLAALAALLVIAQVAGWWRRAYVVVLLAMFAGASHLEAIARAGGAVKVAALGLLMFVTIVCTAQRRGEMRNRMHAFALAGLWVTVTLAVASVFWSVAPLETVARAIPFAAFVFILHRTSTTRWLDRRVMIEDVSVGYWTSWSVLAIGAAMGGLGISGAVSDYSGRHQGFLNNPNLLGMISAITLMIGFGVALRCRRPAIWVSLVIPLSQVLLSQSRTAIIATALGGIYIVVRGRSRKGLLAAGLVLAGALAVANMIGLNPLGDVFSRFGEQQGSGLLNSRTFAWFDSLRYVELNPLGTGWGATTVALDEFSSAGLMADLSSVHNSYLQIVFELGWIGVLPAVFALFVFVGVAIWANTHGLGIGLVAAVVTGAIIQFTESSIFGVGQPYPYLFWFAVLAAVVNTDPRRAKLFGNSFHGSRHDAEPEELVAFSPARLKNMP